MTNAPVNFHKKKRKFFQALAVTLVPVVLVIFLVPWKSLLESKLTALIQSQGLQNVQLKVAAVGLRGINLEQITFGGIAQLTLKNLDIAYSLKDLLAQRLQDLTLTGLAVEIRQTQGRWSIDGLESWNSGASDAKTLITLPVTDESLTPLPFDKIKLKDSTLHITAEQWQFGMPLQFEWHKTPAAEFFYDGGSLRFKNALAEIATGPLTANLQLKPADKQWTGPWALKDIKITGLDADIPNFEASGTLTISEDRIVLLGQLQNAAHDYRTSFRLNYPLNQPEKSTLIIVDASIPWSGGTLSTKNVVMTLSGKQDLKLNLQVQKVSLDNLLQQFTGKRAGATGAISGTLPVTLTADGNILLEQGNLQAEQPGTIAMTPDAIPGDNSQVAIVRDIMQNFHYALLSVGIDQGRDNKTAILMKLEGNNPDMYGGKPVKLNVQLTGDVLNLVQQNILALTNPRKLLEQGKNAKP